MNRALRFISNLLIYVLIIGGVVYGLPKFLVWFLDTPYPLAAITSGSMWPVLNEGDLVFIRGVKKFDLRVGDIIVYRQLSSDGQERGFVIHRIAKLEDARLVTKGDANFDPDPPISYDQVVGRSVSWGGRILHLPYLGSITVFANNLKTKS